VPTRTALGAKLYCPEVLFPVRPTAGVPVPLAIGLQARRPWVERIYATRCLRASIGHQRDPEADHRPATCSAAPSRPLAVSPRLRVDELDYRTYTLRPVYRWCGGRPAASRSPWSSTFSPAAAAVPVSAFFGIKRGQTQSRPEPLGTRSPPDPLHRSPPAATAFCTDAGLHARHSRPGHYSTLPESSPAPLTNRRRCGAGADPASRPRQDGVILGTDIDYCLPPRLAHDAAWLSPDID